MRLVNAFSRPFDNAVATARTCYSSKGIVTAEQVAALDEADPARRAQRLARRDTLAADIFAAGHHTVFQHAHFQFALSNVSRQFVWTFLHSHPFYNSEQVSQRYVEVQAGSVAVPPLEDTARAIYEETAQRLFEAYHRLIEGILPLVQREYFARFPARAHKPDTWAGDIKKKALELARYVLPIGTFTYMYHTVSGLTLLRYWRLCNELDAPLEQRIVVGKMVQEMLRVSPEYQQLLEEPLPLEQTIEFQFYAARNGAQSFRKSFREEFDAQLGDRVSVLVDSKAHNEEILAAAVREILGVSRAELSDDDAIALVLDPAQNPYLGSALNITSMSKLTRAMLHPGYTFRRKLSHTADSQDQRHRMTPGSRPCLPAYLTDEPDYIMPALLCDDRKVEESYRAAMQTAWDGIARLRARGVRDEFAAYLLPNAVAIRFSESADLLGLWHKHHMRLCYNAQEEIWRASLEEAMQIREVNPRIGRWLLPPCGHRDRARARPICPEGKRFCGILVWKLPMSEYQRKI